MKKWRRTQKKIEVNDDQDKWDIETHPTIWTSMNIPTSNLPTSTWWLPVRPRPNSSTWTCVNIPDSNPIWTQFQPSRNRFVQSLWSNFFVERKCRGPFEIAWLSTRIGRAYFKMLVTNRPGTTSLASKENLTEEFKASARIRNVRDISKCETY